MTYIENTDPANMDRTLENVLDLMATEFASPEDGKDFRYRLYRALTVLQAQVTPEMVRKAAIAPSKGIKARGLANLNADDQCLIFQEVLRKIVLQISTR